MNAKPYLVNVTIQSGEYEFGDKALVRALDADEAERIVAAILDVENAQFNYGLSPWAKYVDAEIENDDGHETSSFSWFLHDNHEELGRINSVTELTEPEARVIHKHITGSWLDKEFPELVEAVRNKQEVA